MGTAPHAQILASKMFPHPDTRVSHQLKALYHTAKNFKNCRGQFYGLTLNMFNLELTSQINWGKSKKLKEKNTQSSEGRTKAKFLL